MSGQRLSKFLLGLSFRSKWETGLSVPSCPYSLHAVFSEDQKLGSGDLCYQTPELHVRPQCGLVTLYACIPGA